MCHHVRYEAEDASLRERSHQIVVWPVHGRPALVRRTVLKLSRHECVEAGKSHAQQRMVHEYPETLFILGDTGVHVLRVTAVGEHIGRKYADAENQPQKSKYQHYVPGPPRRPFFAERVDDEREQKREHDW